MTIYLDHNSTTPVAPSVLRAMLPHLRERFGNSSSSHVVGRVAQAAVADSQDCLALLLGVAPSSIVWTSGATEALNMAIKGLVLGSSGRRRKLVCSAVEHKAVLDTAGWLSEQGLAEVTLAPVTSDGEVDYAALEVLVDEQTLGVCVMAANNETGVVNDLERVSSIAHARGALFICDATQQVGKAQVCLSSAGVDFAAVSAHKMYGPQGVGALIAQGGRSVPVTPLIHGGGHQRGWRSGTLNVPGVVGFGAAAQLATLDIDVEEERQGALRDCLESALRKRLASVVVHGASARRLCNTTCVRLPGVDADALIAWCPGVAMSSGSACASEAPGPSHVLVAMGIVPDEAEESIRLSVGRSTTQAEVDDAVELIATAAERIREVNA